MGVCDKVVDAVVGCVVKVDPDPIVGRLSDVPGGRVGKAPVCGGRVLEPGGKVGIVTV